MLWLLLACVSEPGEAARHAQAVAGDLPLEQALALCRTLSDQEQEAACMTDVLAREGAVTPARCEELPEGTAWRDECWFMTSEDARLPAKEREARCARSGRFQPWCYMHAWGAQLEAVIRQDPEPAALAAAVGQIELRWTDTAGATDPDFAERLHNDAWFRWHGRREVIDPSACEGPEVPTVRCQRATEAAIHRLLEGSVRRDPAAYQAVCAAGAVHPELPLSPDGPLLGAHPLAVAEAERLLRRWCIHGQLPPGSWAPRFGGTP